LRGLCGLNKKKSTIKVIFFNLRRILEWFVGNFIPFILDNKKESCENSQTLFLDYLV